MNRILAMEMDQLRAENRERNQARIRQTERVRARITAER